LTGIEFLHIVDHFLFPDVVDLFDLLDKVGVLVDGWVELLL
jgi:hypothetical protein